MWAAARVGRFRSGDLLDHLKSLPAPRAKGLFRVRKRPWPVDDDRWLNDDRQLARAPMRLNWAFCSSLSEP